MKRREPDFGRLLNVINRKPTDTPVLFELFMNTPLYERVNGRRLDDDSLLGINRFTVEAYAKLGYDYATVAASDMSFPTQRSQHGLASCSLNDGASIFDEQSFEAYPWPDPDRADYSSLAAIKPYLPDGMKLLVWEPSGVLETVITLVGYENLCLMLFDDPELVQRIFDEVGSRLLRYYQNALTFDTVGMISSDDDWGFNTQTLLSPAQLRQYVFPWHRRFVETAHAAGRPIMLHSCGYMKDVVDDIVDLGYDAKHSYEDNIMPIENAYEAWHDRFALFGGIDVNFICTKTPEEIKRRTTALIQQTQERGGWAVGTGNSVPTYVPEQNYFAMIEAALGYHPLSR